MNVPPASRKRSSIRWASSGGVLDPMSIVPRQRRLTESGPRGAVSIARRLVSTVVRRVCVYAGSNPGSDPVYAGAARALAGLLAARGIGLVFGGGRVGLMGVLADTVLEAG